MKYEVLCFHDEYGSLEHREEYISVRVAKEMAKKLSKHYAYVEVNQVDYSEDGDLEQCWLVQTYRR